MDQGRTIGDAQFHHYPAAIGVDSFARQRQELRNLSAGGSGNDVPQNLVFTAAQCFKGAVGNWYPRRRSAPGSADCGAEVLITRAQSFDRAEQLGAQRATDMIRRVASRERQYVGVGKIAKNTLGGFYPIEVG